MTYALRPAGEADVPFLWHLRVAAMKEYVARTWGWDEGFQRHYFREHLDLLRLEIIGVGEVSIGALAVEARDGVTFLANIEILPEYQGQGVGSAIIQDLCEQAEQKGQTVELQVLKVNPARRLYERLGFREVGETETHFQLRLDG